MPFLILPFVSELNDETGPQVDPRNEEKATERLNRANSKLIQFREEMAKHDLTTD